MIKLYFTLKTIGLIICIVISVVYIIHVCWEKREVFSMIRDIEKPESYWRKKYGEPGEKMEQSEKEDCE